MKKKLLKDFFILISFSALILFSTIYFVKNENLHQPILEVKKEKVLPDTTSENKNFDLRKNVFSDKSNKMNVIIEKPK